MQDKLEKIIDYRINQAKSTISEVDVLIQHQLFTVAVNRIY